MDSLKLKEAYLGAVEREIALREGYLPERRVSTVYFGGGTPSYLERGELQRIVDALERHYDILPGAERTIELNPEDLTRERFAGIRDMGFNRLSVGVQSCCDDNLNKNIKCEIL